MEPPGWTPKGGLSSHNRKYTVVVRRIAPQNSACCLAFGGKIFPISSDHNKSALCLRRGLQRSFERVPPGLFWGSIEAPPPCPNLAKNPLDLRWDLRRTGTSSAHHLQVCLVLVDVDLQLFGLQTTRAYHDAHTMQPAQIAITKTKSRQMPTRMAIAICGDVHERRDTPRLGAAHPMRGGGGVSAKCEVMGFCLKLATSKKGGGLPLLHTTEIFQNAPRGVTLDVQKCAFLHFLEIRKESGGCFASKVTDLCMLT